MKTVAARYECRDCLRFIYGGDVVWKMPNRAVMDPNIREHLEGPFCPHCDSDNVIEFRDVRGHNP